MPARTGPRLVRVPAIALRVPWTSDVVMTPVIGGGKPNDGYSKRRDAQIGKRTHVAPIVHCEIFAEYPAAISRPNNIAPGFVAQASSYVDRVAFGDDTNAGVVRIGARPQIHIGGGVAWRRLRARNSEGNR